MLEQLARDVTGWPARAVEFFELLATTQYMKHIRPQAAGDRRPARRADGSRSAAPYQAGAFDGVAHTAEMRRIATRRRPLQHPERRHLPVAARRPADGPLAARGRRTATGRRFRFDPLGADMPLFGDPSPEDDITHLAEPLDVPAAAHRPLVRLGRRPGATTTEPGARSCSRPRPAGVRPGARDRDVGHLRPLRRPGRPGDVDATSRTGRRRAGRDRPAPRPRRSPRRAGRRRDAARDLPLRDRRSQIGGGGYDRSADARRRSHTSCTVSGGEALAAAARRQWPAAARSRSSTAAATPRPPRSPSAPRRPGADDRVTSAPVGEPHAAAARRAATSSGSRWSPTRRSCSTGSCSPGRRS